MAQTPYDHIVERLRAQFGQSAEPVLSALGGLLERSDLVSKAEFERAMAELAVLRDTVAELERQLASQAAKPRQTLDP